MIHLRFIIIVLAWMYGFSLKNNDSNVKHFLACFEYTSRSIAGVNRYNLWENSIGNIVVVRV